MEELKIQHGFLQGCSLLEGHLTRAHELDLAATLV